MQEALSTRLCALTFAQTRCTVVALAHMDAGDSFFFDLKFEKCSDRRPVRASYVMGFWYFVLVVAASTSNSTASAWSGRPGPRLALSYVRVRARI